MRTLIIGCGYVGLALGAELARRGHEVFGLRRHRRAAAELEAAGVQPLFGDITRASDLAQLPSGFEWVVNTVSSAHGGVEEYRQTYLEGTRNLIAWLAPSLPRKFVYTSSTGVYAQNDGSVVDESSPTEPETDTCRVLLATEQCLLAAAQAEKFPAVILRLAGIYGPGRGYFFKQFLKGESTLTDGGGRVLNMVHRDDAAGAIIATLEQGRPGEIYNVADDAPVTQLEFYLWLAEQLGRPLPPAETTTAPRKRAPANKIVSNLKLKTELGYHFKYPTFREGYAAELRAAQDAAAPQ